MVTKSKLKMALAAEKGTDFTKLKEKKQRKAAEKRKQFEEEKRQEAESEDSEDEEEGEESDDDEGMHGIDLEAIDDSDSSDSSVDMEERIPRPPKKTDTKAALQEDDEEEEEDPEDDDIPMSDLEDLDEEDREDIVPHAKLTINNTSALLTSLKRFALPTDKSVPFAAHQTVLSTDPTALSIPDVQDDLQRELAFYSQALEAVREGRTKLRAEGVPFSRPKDYFAEMVKEDAHMEKVKAKLVEEATNKKAAAEARKLRDLKKFGKKVQVAKLQERQKEKRETLEKIKTLKRKRQESGGDISTNEADIFDVGVEKELSGYKSKSDRSGPGRGNAGAGTGGANHKRQQKNEKYGFGGKKRHAKSGDAMSSSDLSGFSGRKMKAQAKVSKARPGKNRRKSMK